MAAKSYSRGRPAAQPASSFLTRLAGFVLHHRKRVMAAWGVLFIAGMVAAGAVSNRLSFDFSLPGQPGFETAQKTIAAFGNGGDQAPAIEVVTVPARPRRRGYRRLAYAAAAGLLFGALAVGVLGRTEAVRSLRQKIVLWTE